MEIWEGSRSNGSLISLLRAAASSDDAGKAIHTIFGGQVVPMLARVVPPAELFVRAGLVATQIMGLAVTRYILKVPPVVAMDRAELVKLLGPTMQRYVVGKLCYSDSPLPRARGSAAQVEDGSDLRRPPHPSLCP